MDTVTVYMCDHKKEDTEQHNMSVRVPYVVVPCMYGPHICRSLWSLIVFGSLCIWLLINSSLDLVRVPDQCVWWWLPIWCQFPLSVVLFTSTSNFSLEVEVWIRFERFSLLSLISSLGMFHHLSRVFLYGRYIYWCLLFCISTMLVWFFLFTIDVSHLCIHIISAHLFISALHFTSHKKKKKKRSASPAFW